jgi:hypothetical protein
MSIEVEVSVGEFLDKLTILQIKAERIHAADKLANVRRELEALTRAWSASPYAGGEGLEAAIRDLRGVNETLWDIEDRIRAKEAAGEFDGEFIDLARSVYRTNDRRAAIKRRINLKTGSGVVEEKVYTNYPHAG